MSIKNFGQQTLIYTAGTIAVRATTFLLIPLYTHNLSVSEYGLLSTLLLTVQVLSTIVDFGILNGLMRFHNEYSKEKKEGELLGSAITLNIVSGIIVVLISLFVLNLILRPLLEPQYELRLFVILIALVSVTQSISVNLISYFRARNEAIKYTVFSFLSAIFLATFVFLFLSIFKYEIKGILIAHLITYSLILISVFIWLNKNIKLKITLSSIKLLARFGFPLIFVRSSDLIIGTVSLYLLSTYSNLTQTGIYSLAFRIAQIIGLVLIFPFQLTYEPYIYSHLNDLNIKNTISRITTYLLFAFLIISGFLLFILRDMIKIIAPIDYYGAYFIIFFILPLHLFMGFQYIGQSLLHIKQKTNISGTIVGLTTASNLIALYFSIKYFGLTGLLIANNIFSVLAAILLFYFGNRVYKIDLETKRIIFGSIITIITGGLIFYFSHNNALIYYSALPIISLIIVGFVFRFLLSNEEKYSLKNIMQKFNLRFIRAND